MVDCCELHELSVSSRQFALFRILLGCFLVHHFLTLAPYAAEIYGPGGMYPAFIATPFPNLLTEIGHGGAIQAFVVVLGLLSAFLAAGVQRRIVAVVLWYGWACLVNRIPLLYIPSEGLVGWLLLLCAIVPSGEAASISPQRRADWRLARSLLCSLWLVVGVGYFASGWDKLSSPSWTAGTALRSVLSSPFSYWSLVGDMAELMPDRWIKLLSWSVVGAEIAFLPLSIYPATRPLAWTVLTAMHLGIRLTLDLHTVTDPFLIAHLLMFDSCWVRRGWTARLLCFKKNARTRTTPSGTSSSAHLSG